jgi:hypothetical protein
LVTSRPRSQGREGKGGAVLDQVLRLNPDGKVKVHIVFFGPDWCLTTSVMDTLWRIADVNGATFDC